MLSFKFTLILLLCILPSFTIYHKSNHKSLHQHKAKQGAFQINLHQERSLEKEKKYFSFLQNQKDALKVHKNFLGIGVKEEKINLKNQPAMIALKNIMNTQYVGTIGVGSPDKEYSVIFDTGSTPFFIDSSLCTESACLLRNQVDPHDSKTMVLAENPMGLTVTYGSGEVDGVLAQEDIYLGEMKAPLMNIFLISNQFNILDFGGFDGVVGLGFKQKTDSGTEITSVFELVQDKFPDPYISFNLKRNDQEGSYVMFGGYNRDHINEDLSWHNVIDETYWMVSLDNVYVGDKTIDLCKEKKCGVIIDSGTSVMTAPSVALAQMGSVAGDLSCFNYPKLPEVGFEIDGKVYKLSPSEYVMTTNLLGETEFYEHSEDFVDCSGLFTPMNLTTEDDIIVFLLGDLFFSRYYTVFDSKNRRIGMAHQKSETQSADQ